MNRLPQILWQGNTLTTIKYPFKSELQQGTEANWTKLLDTYLEEPGATERGVQAKQFELRNY